MSEINTEILVGVSDKILPPEVKQVLTAFFRQIVIKLDELERRIKVIEEILDI